MKKQIIYKGYPIRQQKNPYLKDHASWTVDALEFNTIDRIKAKIDKIENGTYFGSDWEKFKVN